MDVTILGCSGSLGGPDNPASGYLLNGDTHPLLVDIGPGVVGAYQKVGNPSDAHLVLSHLHADHCMDFPSLIVWRRYHPTRAAQALNFMRAPGFAPTRLGALSADINGEIDSFADTFDFEGWVDGCPTEVGEFTITPRRAIHPTEAYCLRIVHRPSGTVVAYSGDTDMCDNLIDTARCADIFLCEACWGATSEGKAPDMHLSGREAGIAARLAGVKHLVLVHIPPWEDPDSARVAAAAEFDGPITVASPGDIVRP